MGSVGLRVLEGEGDSEGIEDVCWGFEGLKLGRGGLTGGVWCKGGSGAGLGQSLFPAEGTGMCRGQAAAFGAGGWLPVSGDALKKPWEGIWEPSAWS